MSDPYLGQIMLFAGNFAPVHWLLCQGQQMSIAGNTALYSLIGNYYGGNGVSVFNLPNLQGIVVSGTNGQIAAMTGTPNVKLTSDQLASHNHLLVATSVKGTSLMSGGNALAVSGEAPREQPKEGVARYSTSKTTTTLGALSIAPGGGGGAHNNMQPYLVLNYCICINGIFPPRP